VERRPGRETLSYLTVYVLSLTEVRTAHLILLIIILSLVGGRPNRGNSSYGYAPSWQLN